MWSSEQLKVTVAEDEETLQELERFSIWGLVKHLMHEQSNESTIGVSLFCKKTCFRIDPADDETPYTVKPIRSK